MFHLSAQLPGRLYALLAFSLTLVTVWFVTSGPDVPAANAAKLTNEQTAASLEKPGSRPTVQDEAEWTIMLYQDADDETLEQDILIDFNEAERIGSTDQVNIVAQVDRFDGAFDGMDDWTSTKRFYVTQDDDLSEIGSEELEDLGEINMADGQSLIDFITWAAENFPANRYVLILSDHGMGWPGGWSDPDPGGLGADDIVLAQLFNDGIWLMELDLALEEAKAQAGIEEFELIGFDACLMGQLEVFSAVAPHARYSVASQEVEPAMGWAYTAFLGELANNPEMDGAELTQLIVETYIDRDERIVDDLARQELLLQEFGFEGEATPAEVAEIKGQDVTLTAVDLAAIADVNAAVDNLTATLVNIDPQIVAEARAYAQPFESVFGEEYPSPYVDLGHLMQLLVELSGDDEVAAAVDEVQTALNQAILAEKHGPNRPGATGLSIYFPTGDLYNIADNLGYAIVAERFAGESQWDDFLLSFHSGDGAGFSRPDNTPRRAAGLPDGLTQEDVDMLLTNIAALQDAGYVLNEIPQAMVDEFGYNLDFVQALLDNGFFNAIPSRAGSRAAAAAGPKPIEVTPLTLSA
ncbi:MAG TPA: clostripain-related cysteine peptidase, partial [Anaerolineae bacterium]|nr:clostripain-related cysteine peptidase [Anaerolineae bacterium]